MFPLSVMMMTNRPHYTHYPRCLFVSRFRPPYSHTFTYDRDDIDLRPEYCLEDNMYLRDATGVAYKTNEFYASQPRQTTTRRRTSEPASTQPHSGVVFRL